MSQALRRLIPDNAVLALGLITLIGLGLRVWQIARVPLWSDEALTAIIAHWPYLDLLRQPVDPSGALYYWLHKALIPDGASAVISRSISLVAGVFIIPLTYIAARLAIGPRAGLVAAGLAALSRPLIDYSQEDRSYSILLLLVLASAIGLLRWGQELARPEPKTGPLVLFGGTVVLAQYTHLVAAFWSVTAFHAAISETLRNGSSRAKRWVLAVSGVTLLFLIPEAWRLVRHVTNIGTLGWLRQASFAQFLQTVADSWLPSGLWQNRWWDADSGTVFLVPAIAGLLVWTWLHRDRRRTLANPFAPTVIVGLLLFPLFVWLFGFAFSPIFMQRTILPSILGFILVLALIGNASRPLVACGLLAAYAASVLLAGTVRVREPWREVVARVSGGVQSGDAVIVCPIWKYPAFRVAMAKGLPAPSYLLRRGEMLAIEAPLGADRQWEDTFYRAILRDGGRESLRVPQTWLGEVTLAPPLRRLWLVDSQCPIEDRRMIVAWSGVRNWRQLGRWGAAAAQISVYVTEVPPDLQRRLLVERSG